jgi:SAM-dependent methyltransferase
MNAAVVRILYRLSSRVGFNPSLDAADVPDTRLIELVEGPERLEPGRALDLGCGAGRNTLYLARHGWDAVGVDMLDPAVEKARSRAVGAAASTRFMQGDVTRLDDLDLGDGFTLIVDSGCYKSLSHDQRDAYAKGITRVAAPGALLVIAGTKLRGTRAGMTEDDLRRRFQGWEIRANAAIPLAEIIRHTRVPPPMKAALRIGLLEIRRFELSRTSQPSKPTTTTDRAAR